MHPDSGSAMPFSASGFSALRQKIEQYVHEGHPMHHALVSWPDSRPTRAEPDFSFTVIIGAQEATLTLSALDVEKGSDWKTVIDDILNNLTIG
jgi:lysozyme family protein